MITFKQKGNLSKTYNFLHNASKVNIKSILNSYGREGVRALELATPKETGKTAESWYYEIVQGQNSISLSFKNSNVVNGVPVVILLQYGHGTQNGSYVQGRDFINPALKPIFDKIADSAWREVTR